MACKQCNDERLAVNQHGYCSALCMASRMAMLEAALQPFAERYTALKNRRDAMGLEVKDSDLVWQGQHEELPVILYGDCRRAAKLLS